MNAERPAATEAQVVITVGEQDYLYGIGPLRLAVPDLRPFLAALTNLDWISVHGMELDQDDRPRAVRRVQVRMTALRAALEAARPLEEPR